MGSDVRKLRAAAKKKHVDSAVKEKRSAAARRAVQTRERKLMEWAENVTITIDTSYVLTGDERADVNTIRHEYTQYEEYLGEIRGEVGRRGAYLRIKERVLDAIAEEYPELFDECREQYSRAVEQDRLHI